MMADGNHRWLGAVSGESTPLTVETLLAAMEKVERESGIVCGVHRPHAVHPRARGWTPCANCFQPVWIKEGETP